MTGSLVRVELKSAVDMVWNLVWVGYDMDWSMTWDWYGGSGTDIRVLHG